MEQDKKQIIFLVLMVIFIILLIITIAILIKNKDLISQDPIRYSMQQNNYTSCSCLGNNGYINYNLKDVFPK